MQKRYIANYVVIAAFLAGICFPLAWTSRRGVSQVEKRQLAPFPGIPLTLSAVFEFPGGFEAFYNDHFGFRERLVYLYNVLNVRLGVSPTEKVLVGKDGWFFYASREDGNVIQDYRNNDPLTASELAMWQADLEQKQRWLQAQGIAYLFVIAPNKHTIYAEYMPNTITKVGEKSRADQLIEHLAAHTTAPVLDLRPVMLAAKGSGPPLYDRTSTHWNAWGANLAQDAIATTLAAQLPAIAPVRYAATDFRDQLGAGDEDLTGMMAVGDAFSQPSPVLTVALPACEQQILEDKSYRFRSQRPFQTTCPVAEGIDAMIFHDSFFIALQPTISTYFHRATYVWTQPDLATLQASVEEMHPQVVIEERAARYLKEGLVLK